MYLGEWASVADAERVAIAKALERHRETEDLIIFSDSLTAIVMTVCMGEGKPAQSRIEKNLATLLRKKRGRSKKNNIDIPGNELADRKAVLHTEEI